LVAQAILYAAEHRVRELTVGGGAGLLTLAALTAPGVIDPLLAIGARLSARSALPPNPARLDNLHHAGQDLRERAFQPGVRESSLYTTAQMNPRTTIGLAALVALAAAAAFKFGMRRSSHEGPADD
jgi:hypothetical protein